MAIGIARLGGRALWAGRVGADSVGERIERELRSQKVELLLQRDHDHATGLMLKEWPYPGSTRVHYYRSGSAGSCVGFTDELAEAIASAELLHVTGITPALSHAAALTVRRAIETAKAHSTAVSFDVNYRSALWSREVDGRALAPLLADVDILFAGLDEAALLTGSDADGSPLEAAEITLGEDGAIALV